MKQLTLIAISAALLLSACQTPQTTAPAPATRPAGSAYIQHLPLLHTRWILSQIDQTAVVVDQPEHQPFIQLSVDQHSNRLMGMGGCNRLMGSYQLNGAQLQLAVVSTKRYCAELHRIESTLLSGLARTASYHIDQRTLTLKDHQGTPLMQFQAID